MTKDEPITPEHRLFVYGTLAPGEKNHHIMDGMTGKWQTARVKGHKGHCLWGDYAGYPGFTPDTAGPIVDGQLFTSADLPDHWARLDAFEGYSYRRVPIDVTLGDGTIIAAQIYRVLPPPEENAAGLKKNIVS